MPTREMPVTRARRAECSTPFLSLDWEARRPPRTPAMPMKCNIRSTSRAISMVLSVGLIPICYLEVVALGVRRA